VVAISSLLDPEAIVFGGGTSEAGEALLRRVRERIAPHLAIRPRLVLAKLGSDSQIYGALWGAAGMVRMKPGQVSALRARRPGRLPEDLLDA
jgi:predicted NBD/HSP70 family sugar kinase